MRVAHIIGFFSPIGGMTQVVCTLTREMRARGHAADIVYWDGAADAAPADVRGLLRRVDVFGLSRHTLGSNIARKLGKSVFGRHLHPWLGARFFTPRLARQLARDYDICAFHDMCYFGFRHWPGPHVFVAHVNQSQALLAPLGATRPLLRGACARAFRGKACVAVSAGVKADLVERFGVAPGAVRVIENPFDFAAARALAREPGEMPREPYIVGVGRMVAQKRFDVLLRAYALAELDEDLVLVGDGRERKRLEKLCSELGLAGRVHFVGTQANPYPFVKNARLLAMSSDFEGLPMTLLEALALGTPVVSTDCTGPGEILTGELARGLAPVGDAPALARAMRDIVAAPPPLPASFEARFDASRIAGQYLDCFAEVAAG